MQDSDRDTSNAPSQGTVEGLDGDDLTQEAAAKELLRLKSDPQFSAAILDRRDPQHDSAMARLAQLNQRAKSDPQEGQNSEPSTVAATNDVDRQGKDSLEPDQAKIELARLKNDPSFVEAILNKNNPRHAECMARMELLRQQASKSASNDEEEEPETGNDSAQYREALRLANVRNKDADLDEISAGLQSAQSWFAEAGLSPSEASAAVKAFNDASAVTEEDLEALQKPEEVARVQRAVSENLHTVWGDQFDEKVSAAIRAVNNLDKGGELIDLLEETRLGDNPQIIKMMADIAERKGW